MAKDHSHPPASPAQIAAVRGFNRMHTRVVGALNEHLLASCYSLPQVRVLYEVAHAPKGQAPSARDLAGALQVDTGYLSRLITGLEKDGVLTRCPSATNAKRLELNLTPAGQSAFAALSEASCREVAALLAPLPEGQRRDLVAAMSTIRHLLAPEGAAAADRLILRDLQPGDMGLITERNARIYADEYGWDWTFEALVAQIVGQFVTEFDPTGDRAWIAELDGKVVGSVMVVRKDAQTAKLRLLWVDPAARGMGLGARLVEACLDFARAAGYARIELWTNDCLGAARRLYQAAGFELIEETPHHSFGKDLVGQVWARDLEPLAAGS